MVKLDQLSKFIKTTDLIVIKIEDDSSGTGVDGDGVQMKVLHLLNEVTAVGSSPLADGKLPSMKSKEVRVAADNIDEFLKDCTVEDEDTDPKLVYKGQMHLDVAKPRTRENLRTGQTIITSPARIFLTKVKFGRLGNQIRQRAADGRQKALQDFFGGDKAVEVGSTDVGAMANATQTAKTNEPEPVLVGDTGGKKGGKQ